MFKRYILLLIFQVMINGLSFSISNSSILSAELSIRICFLLANINDVLLCLMFFYLIKSSNYEALSVCCVMILYKFYIMFTDFFMIEKVMLIVYIENIILILFVIFQSSKDYNVDSDEISKNTVCLVFYKPKTFKQYITSTLGLPFSSVGAIIKSNIYIMEYGKSTIQEKKYDEDKIKERYLVIDTKVNVKDVQNIIPFLLKQRARQFKTLYLRYNCLRGLIPLLNIMGYKWKYRGEVFPSIYLKKRINNEDT